MRARRTSKNLNFWQTVNYFVFSTTRPPSIFDFSFCVFGSTDPRNNNNKQTIQFLLFKLYLKFRKTCCFYYLWHYVDQKSSSKSVYEKFYENNKQTSFSLFIFYGNLLLFAVFMFWKLQQRSSLLHISSTHFYTTKEVQKLLLFLPVVRRLIFIRPFSSSFIIASKCYAIAYYCISTLHNRRKLNVFFFAHNTYFQKNQNFFIVFQNKES